MATNPEVISEAALEREPHRLVKAHKLTVAEGVALSVATSLKRIADMMESQVMSHRKFDEGMGAPDDGT